MKISVFGLGHVAAVTAACLAKLGHDVVGVESNPDKARMVAAGQSPVVETDLEALIAEQVHAGRLRATTYGAEAVAATDITLVCVGTPSRADGDVDLVHLQRVADEIGSALVCAPRPHTVVIRSTVLPGTTEEIVVPILERASGKRRGDGWDVAFHPEFLRESTAVQDFFAPPKVVVGVLDDQTGAHVAAMYGDIDAPVFVTQPRIAEMVKYADNAFHALKVTFGNEIGAICRSSRLDSHRVMEIFCADTKLNISPAYLRPGFAYGGSCLPKDLRALTSHARALGIEAPVLDAIQRSNAAQIRSVVDRIAGLGRRDIGLLGLAFKAGTADLRESPLVEIAERLLDRGHQLHIFDANLALDRVIGANRRYIDSRLPRLSALLVESAEALAASAGVIVVGTSDPAHRRILAGLRPDQVVFDLVRLAPDVTTPAVYEGVAW